MNIKELSVIYLLYAFLTLSLKYYIKIRNSKVTKYILKKGVPISSNIVTTLVTSSNVILTTYNT